MRSRLPIGTIQQKVAMLARDHQAELCITLAGSWHDSHALTRIGMEADC